MSTALMAIIVILAVVKTRVVQSVSLRPLISASGSPYCGIGNPSILIENVMSSGDVIGIEMGVPGVARCAYQCSGMSSGIGCAGFNYIRYLPSSGQCQFFRRSPLNCNTNVVFGCTYYEVFSGSSQSSACSAAQPTCTFPLTRLGQLYYQCIDVPTADRTNIACMLTGTTQLSPSMKCYGSEGDIALKRRAIQMTTNGQSYASLAVDGSFGNPSCTNAGTVQVHHWWTVDLSQTYNVRLVNVTNAQATQNSVGLDNFLVWLSNVSPVANNSLNANTTTACGQLAGSFAAQGYTAYITCPMNLPTQFRYVILQSSLVDTPICLDQVQVYYAFVAQITTVNVSLATPTPLRSVFGWLTIMSRVDSSFPTNLDWTSYKLGFGDIMSNFWLGLERMYQLTNMDMNGKTLHRLRFEVQSTTQRWYSEEFNWFYLDSETQFYTLHTSLTATGDAGDSINSAFQPGANSNGMPFSSKDADHDQSSINCAATYLGGWWYNGCSSSKQLGTASSNFMWNSLCKVAPAVAPDGGLLASRMMIIPIA